MYPLCFFPYSPSFATIFPLFICSFLPFSCANIWENAGALVPLFLLPYFSYCHTRWQWPHSSSTFPIAILFLLPYSMAMATLEFHFSYCHTFSIAILHGNGHTRVPLFLLPYFCYCHTQWQWPHLSSTFPIAVLNGNGHTRVKLFLLPYSMQELALLGSSSL